MSNLNHPNSYRFHIDFSVLEALSFVNLFAFENFKIEGVTSKLTLPWYERNFAFKLAICTNFSLCI